MTEFVPQIAASLVPGDPRESDAAARALVSLGDDAVAAGRAALAASKEPEAATVLLHLEALAVRRTVEREVFARWRRKGGTYQGRFNDLAKLGWPVQPVLLGMLLDVPLTDRQIVLPATTDAATERSTKLAALTDIYVSNRRGYRTFDPLPPQVEQEEVFDLASQALRDLGDLKLMGNILETVAGGLENAERMNPRQLRQWNKSFYTSIDVILFERGRPRRLRETAASQQRDLAVARSFSRGSDDPDRLGYLATKLEDYASTLHQMHQYDAAADLFAEAITIMKELGGKEPAIYGYNRACALARSAALSGDARKKTEAIEQLSRSLDRDQSTGFEDLTREWVVEDGDLESLHDDPRFAEVIKKRFGE
jgi:hypothetical protein